MGLFKIKLSTTHNDHIVGEIWKQLEKVDICVLHKNIMLGFVIIMIIK